MGVVGRSVCLTQHGIANGVYNVALRAAAVASSSADDLTHGAAMAVDGRSTYWASRLAPTSPEELSVDFGFSSRVQAAEIEWEYPAKSFSIQVSEDGARWVEVYSTDINMLNTTRIRLGHILARKAKVVMAEPHVLYGKLHGRTLYGIRSLSFTADGFQTLVEDCAHAEKSNDARDKFFFIAAGSFNEADNSKILRSEVPALNAARASLATVVSFVDGVAAAAALPSAASFDACHARGESDGDEDGSRAVSCNLARIALSGRFTGRHVGKGFRSRAAEWYRPGGSQIVVDGGPCRHLASANSTRPVSGKGLRQFSLVPVRHAQWMVSPMQAQCGVHET